MHMIELQAIVDSGLFILIWVVQLIIYPSFRYTDEKEFVAWHSRYTGLIGLIVSPLIFLQVCVEVSHVLQQDVRWQRILMILVVWISTFSLSVPCHNRLRKDGKNLLIINRLVKSNWVRTVFWTLLFLESVFALFLT